MAHQRGNAECHKRGTKISGLRGGGGGGILDFTMSKARGFSVFTRKGRSVYYVTYLDAESGAWVQKASNFRVDDPQGHKKATRWGEQMAARFFRSASAGSGEAFGNWVRAYLLRRYRLGSLTHTRYVCAWDNLASFMTERKIHRPAQWSYVHNQEYLDWRTAQTRNNGKKYTRNTAIFELKLLSTLMQEAVRRGYLTHNPIEKLGIPRDPPKEKRELSDDEIQKLRAFVTEKEKGRPLTEQWQTVCLEVALHQGCRLSETSLPMSDVNEEAGTITFRGKGRDGRQRVFTTQLHPGLAPLMRELRAAGATRTCHLPKMAGKIWFFDFAKAGVAGASFHCTRVTVITRMARAMVPEQMARRFVNHASKAVHSIYQKLKPEDLSVCVAALRPGGPGAQSPGGPPTKP